jgi:hypothetical protein
MSTATQDPRATVMALARHFQMYEEARSAIERLDAAERAAALRRGLRSDADPRSIVLAALIVHMQQPPLGALKCA